MNEHRGCLLRYYHRIRLELCKVSLLIDTGRYSQMNTIKSDDSLRGGWGLVPQGANSTPLSLSLSHSFSTHMVQPPPHYFRVSHSCYTVVFHLVPKGYMLHQIQLLDFIYLSCCSDIWFHDTQSTMWNISPTHLLSSVALCIQPFSFSGVWASHTETGCVIWPGNLLCFVFGEV